MAKKLSKKLQRAIVAMGSKTDKLGALYPHWVIAKELGVSQYCITRYMREAGLSRKSKRAISCKTRMIVSALEEKRNYTFSKTTTEIAREFDVTTSDLRQIGKRRGVRKRPRRRQGWNHSGLNEKFFILSLRNTAPVTLPRLKFMETKADDECE